jgi:nucleoside-diphosphate-sugar epimerase
VSSLVTGASGFLGGRLAQMLVAQGEEVVVLARASSDLRHLPVDGIRVVRGDLADAAALDAALVGGTRVFHCAACSTDWAPAARYQAANVEGTANLLAAALRAGRLERFVHVSTTDIYGYPMVPCGENSPFVDAGLPYNHTKGVGEGLVWAAARESGLPMTIVRPATIYGPRGRDFTLEIATLLRQRLMATIDHGRAPGGFVYVDTVAQAMIDASVSAATLGQAYNLADGFGVTWAEYLREFAGQLGTKEPWIDLSSSMAMRLAGVFEGVHRMLRLGGRPLLTGHAVLLLGRSQEFPVAKARRDFGFEARVGLEEGVRRSVAWLRGGG